MGKFMIGKNITAVKIADDKESLLFVDDHGNDLIATVDADCCSQTWIESVEIPALGFPFEIISIEHLDMPDLGDMPGCDVVTYYGVKLTTSKGDMVIDFRNDSNGYYGGSIDFPTKTGYPSWMPVPSWIDVE